MRFFRPALSPVTLVKMTSPLVFPFVNKSIQEIRVSHDLSLLQVHATADKTNIDTTLSALKNSIEEIPDEVKLKINKPVFQLHEFYSVAMVLRQTMNEIKMLDPTFFAELQVYEKSLQSNLADNTLKLGDFMTSPLHMHYFYLQAMRRMGVKHTIEFPLKSLRLNGLLSMNDLNQMMMKIWARLNAIEKAQTAKTHLPVSTEDVPYIFRV